MKRELNPNANQSVLNTDAFDKRRFTEIFRMSSGLQKVHGESALPLIGPLLGDIWASLYKMKPRLTDGPVDERLKMNKTVMERIMADEHFLSYRQFTRLHDLLSAIGTMRLGEMTNRWVTEQMERDQELEAQIRFLHAQHRKLQKAESDDNSDEHVEEDFLEAIGIVDAKLQQLLEDNSNHFSVAIAENLHETAQVRAHLSSLLGGYSAGSGEGDLKKVPLRDQLLLAEKLTTDKKMREIAEWAGRFKEIARKKQHVHFSDSVERRGITVGTDIERLLPIELGSFIHPLTKKDFLRRFLEGQTMQYEQRGRERLEKGPIVLCLDQSGSMNRLDAQSKGFTLALVAIARKQRRDFCLIVFSTDLHIFTYDKGKMNVSEMVSMARNFLGGGTDFTLPLVQAMKVIEESKFEHADVIFVTDGEDQVKDPFLEAFHKTKKEKKFNVLSLVLGNEIDEVAKFSDRVVQVTGFDEEGSFTAFDI